MSVSGKRMGEAIKNFLNERIEAGDFPSAVFLAGEKGRIAVQGALGNAVVEPETIRAAVETIYDMASVTKVLVTGLLLARLVEEGAVSLADRVADHLSEFKTQAKSALTISQLSAHISGLPAWIPLSVLLPGPEKIVDHIAGLPLGSGTEEVVYSDLNFIILGKVIEAVTGKELDDAANELIFRPLGLKRTMFCPPRALRNEIAASERGNGYERQMSVDRGFAAAEALEPGGELASVFRERQIWGEVHDGNAYFMGGVAGHAGLFSSAEDVFKIAQQFLPATSELLAADTCELFTTDLTPFSDERRSMSFQLATTRDSTAGPKMSPKSFGHLGFTGTSLWIDPISERVYILLTNRTHHHAFPFVIINSVRRRYHELAAEFLDENF